uniref:Staphylococcal nuclease homologue n=1 Tax=Mimiviridae sp. ChoanoV1 TaxID=2596887 RepID=A0A5B8IJ57_9VIRU|nr:staphylococcal nuclease homologue [Mimiviridae sp. ChoanoV1]
MSESNNHESDEIIQQLKVCDKKTPKFSLQGLTKICKVVDIYDGDTCRVVFNHNGCINKWNIRMNGYDSPEMRPSRNLENRDEIKKKALESKNFLKSLVANSPEQLVYLKCGGFDKYGRLLGELYVNLDDEKSANQQMIDNNYGYVYHGGTKKV